jgi:Bifunctional DNA primase/polymerase, N-terminal
MPNLDLIMAALEAYTALGWHLFPVVPLERNPMTKRGCNDATNDLDALHKRWRKAPDANIGVHCGRSGICAVDIDPRNGGEASVAALASKGLMFPRTLRAITASGGFHLIYRAHDAVKNSASKLGAGIDTRGGNGYILLSPSLAKRKDGPGIGAYEWMDGDTGEIREDQILKPDELIAPFPLWAIDILRPPPRPEIYRPIRPLTNERAQERLQRQAGIIRSTSEGNRNGTLSSRAYFAWKNYVQSGVASEGDVAARLISASVASGLTVKEATETVEKAFAQARRKAA